MGVWTMIPFEYAFERNGAWDRNKQHLSDLMQEALRNYVVYGLPPGSFLTSVLANDLCGAATRADHVNVNKLAYIARWVLHNVPDNAKGSYEAVREWHDNPERVAYQDKLEKEYIWDKLKEPA
jgi:hypothetical protein